jgi:hypothetical protein
MMMMIMLTNNLLASIARHLPVMHAMRSALAWRSLLKTVEVQPDKSLCVLLSTLLCK